MEQTKALNALEPFLALSKSATSPRAAADLVSRATSAPNTFIFAELLQTPTIAALANSPDYAAYHALLEIFSHGTYETYVAAQDLPELSDAQALKLRQLSLLSLARNRNNLSYTALLDKLGLDSHRRLEELVITAVYAGLLEATLDPTRQAVQVTSIAPLRDLHPGAVPEMVSILNMWSDRCVSTLADLENQIQSIRSTAAVREKEATAAEQRLQTAIAELKETDKSFDAGPKRELGSRRAPHRRQVATQGVTLDPESMEVDDPMVPDELPARASKRKM